MNSAGSSVVLTFMMSEAQLSKMDSSRLRTILDLVDAMDAEACSSLSFSGMEGTAFFDVSIGSYKNVKLSYVTPEYEDVCTVDFDTNLRIVETLRRWLFVTIVLLSNDDWDPEAILFNMRSKWGMTLDSAEMDVDAVIGTISGDLVVVSMIRSRVP